MSRKKITGDPLIDAVLGNLEKQYGENNVMLGPPTEKVKRIPTGALGLDVAIGGGLPVGRIVELFGPESSGKTSLALSCMKSWQDSKSALDQEERYGLVIDLEHSITEDLVEGIGVDPENVLWTKPKTAEQGFNTLIDLVRTGKVGFVIVDSVDAAQTEAVLKKKVGEDQVGGISKAMSRLCRELSGIAEETQTTCLFINQVRADPSPFGGLKTPGGFALKFYSSLRLQTMMGKPSTKTPNALAMRVKIAKNKVSPPRTEPVAFDFMYARGVEPYQDLINVLKETNRGRFAGPTFMVCWGDNGEYETLCSGGTNALVGMLQEDTETFNKLVRLCLGKDEEVEETDGTEQEQAS